MRILVHDFSGHPFQVELSRALAARHDVLHVHCPDYATGKGRLIVDSADVNLSLSIQAIEIGQTWDRYRYGKRVWQEIQYGRSFTEVARNFAPDVVLSSNDPLFAKATAAWWCHKHDVPWVFWLQDIYSVAMGTHARQTLGVLGSPVATAFEALERRMLHAASGVISITDDFLPLLEEWRVPAERTTVIENWAPLHEIEPRRRVNSWSRHHGIESKSVVLYAGTLGLKHDPSLLLAVAERFRHDPSVLIVVVSEGLGADWLEQEACSRELPNVLLLPFQPWEQMSDVLASATVLVALLEPDAGVYSVPSKVLTYLCAGRAIVGAMPTENLAARLISRVGAGWVAPPCEVQTFVDMIARALDNEEALIAAGAAARKHAQRAFDIETVRARFESALATAIGTRPVGSS